MGARRTSRLIASAVAVATFSSITVVPSAVAADDTTFVEEKTTDDTVSLNGIEFDEEGNLLEENNAGDKAMEELDAEEDAAESITPYAVDGAEETAEAPASEESAKPTTLEELAQTEASNGDVNVKVVKDEQKDKLVCEVTDAPDKEGNMLDLKLALAKAFYDGGEKIIKTVWEIIPVVGDLVPADFIDKISGKTWDGIAKLVKEGEKFAVLTDILGDEDHLGDMDFKVAGTKDFVTAIQLDTKLDGIPASVLGAALKQAREARLHILDVLTAAVSEPDEMSEFAPRIITAHIPVSKIGEVIGPKGKMINQIQEDTGADITVEDDGTIYIGAVDGPSADAARSAINAIANPQVPEVGERYLGTVVKTTTFGAFVSLTPGKDGLLHISELRKLNDGQRVNDVEDVVSVGQKVQVEITKVDDRGKLSLAPVVLDEDEQEGDEQ